jgi:uncharacterized protein (DUF927 family)
VSAILEAQGGEVSVIDARKLAAVGPEGNEREPEVGWDAANALTDWANSAALRSAIVACTNPQIPKPAFVSYGRFTMSSAGLTAEKDASRGGNESSTFVWVASAFEILGASRDPEGMGWGKWIRWHDADDQIHHCHVSDAALQGDMAALCGKLADSGLRINRTEQRAFVSYLCGAEVNSRVTHVARTGWHEIKGRQVFVLPDETFGLPTSERVVLEGSPPGEYESRGAISDWQQAVGKLSRGHTLPVLAISTALAGPLLYLARQEGGGININGASSTGKTTVVQAGASVWGRGTTPGYVRSWRSTANGLEGVAAVTTDTVLVLDELGLMEARDFAGALYSLSNGAGKSRARRDGSLASPRSWRVLVISSGELAIETKLAEDRTRKARAGQLVRMLDIPGDRGLGFGVFDNGGSQNNAAALANDLKLSARIAYGTAGPEFLRRIMREGADEVGTTIRDAIQDFTHRFVPHGSDGQVVRAGERLGLIAAAGELATALGITPWEPGEPTKAAAWAFEQWLRMRGGTEPAEVRQAIDQVRLFIEQHGEARFEDADQPGDRPVTNRAGWRKGRDADREWLVPPEVWKTEICAGLDAKSVAKVLAEQGILRRASDGYQSVVRIGGRPVRVYVLQANIIEGGGDAG